MPRSMGVQRFRAPVDFGHPNIKHKHGVAPPSMVVICMENNTGVYGVWLHARGDDACHCLFYDCQLGWCVL